MVCSKLFGAAAGAILYASTVKAQGVPLSQFIPVTTFPNEQTENTTRWMNEAEAISREPLIRQFFVTNCITQQKFPALFSMPSMFVDPFAAFDNFYFVGQGSVAAWAYDTGDGIVLIDALFNQEQVEGIIFADLANLGFQPTDIKAVIITHEHLDHYGGVRYLQDAYNVPAYATAEAWETMLALPANDTTKPLPGETVEDNQVLTFGTVDFEIIKTPGHTPGTLSLFFPVTEKNVTHLAGFSGGTGNPSDPAAIGQKIESQTRFGDLGQSKGVDVLLSNHWVSDHSVLHSDLLAHRTASTPNPFVVGVEGFRNYMLINAYCTRVQSARKGVDLPV